MALVPISRRGFLLGSGAAAGLGLTGAAVWEGLLRDRLDDASSSGPRPAGLDGDAHATNPDRVLVVVALNGGNDALNCVVPTGVGRYHDARPTLALADAGLTELAGTGGFALAPGLAPIADRWDDGQLELVLGVGFPDQTRSHFAALDTWWSATPGQVRTTGWIGRWLDAVGIVDNPLAAVSLGSSAPMLVARQALSTVVLDPDTFRLRAPRGSDAATLAAAFRATAAPVSPEPLVAAAQRAVPATLDAIDRLAPALGDVDPDEPSGPTSSGGTEETGSGEMTRLLRTAAGLLELRVGTRVVVVSGGSFDTHADQTDRQGSLLADLGTGLAAFHADIEAMGRADDVLVVTTSEFGRRVRENGSGTDHGKGGVELLLGAGARPRAVHGGYSLDRPDDGDIPIGIDTRSVFATALDWLGGPTDDVLGGPFDRLT